MSDFHIKPLGRQHDRSTFSCGADALSQYFQTRANQDIRRRVAHFFVAVESTTGTVAAYYTLASASTPTPDLPQELASRLPRYPTIPAVLIGRLAFDTIFQGRGLDAGILADACQRVISATPAAFALLVDAKDEDAVSFYRHHGFLPLMSAPRTLFLPIATAAKALPGR